MLELFSLAQIDQMSWATIALICFIALTTAAIHGATGVAGGFLLTSALALVIGVKPIVPVVSVALLISHSTRALLNSGAFDRKVFLSVTLPALPCILVFALLYGRMSAPVIAVFLGVVILASIPLRYWAASRHIKVSKVQLGAAGAVYGTLSGASIGGGDAVGAVFIGLWLAARGFCGNPSRDCPSHEYRPSRGLWHHRFAQRGVVFIGDFGRVNDDTGQLVWAVCVATDKQ